jgi:hypothetical protein
MLFLKYLYYRMYKAYDEKNDSPLIRTFMYMTLVEFYIVGSVLIYLEKLLILGNLFSEVDIAILKSTYTFWGSIILSIFLFTYMYFFRRHASYYDDLFSHHHSLNKTIKIWMLIVFPFFLFFISINIYIFIFGGQVLRKEVIGIINL